MSDESVLVSSPVAEEGAGVTSVSAGTLLRRAREASGLHVAALAVAMKVPVKKLEALEADRLDDLPDAVFVRALAASVCRTLKIDAGPILSRLPQSAVPRLDGHERGLNTPVRTQRVVVVPSLTAMVAKPSVLLVGLILLAVLAVLFLPEIHLNTAPSPAAPVAEVPAMAAAPIAPDGTVTPAAAPVAAVVAAPEQAAAPAQAPAVVATVAPAATPAATPAAGLASASAAPVSGLLVFKASAASWVRVSDSNGAVVFEKTLQAGESAAANGSGTLSVVVGNVAGTEVMLRGKPFQMVDLNQNNVARFEVK